MTEPSPISIGWNSSACVRSIRAAALAVSIVPFFGCSNDVAGTGLETSSVVLSILRSDGAPAIRVPVTLAATDGHILHRASDASGAFTWDTSAWPRIYVGGLREAASLTPGQLGTARTIHLAQSYRIAWNTPLAATLSVREAPGITASAGTLQLGALPTGTWTLDGIDSLHQEATWRLQVSEEVSTLERTAGSLELEPPSVSEVSCGLADGRLDITPARYCWYTKQDDVLAGDSVRVEPNGGSLRVTMQTGEGYGSPGSSIAVALRFSMGGPTIQLDSMDTLRITGDFPSGIHLTLSIVTQDHNGYAFLNQPIVGNGNGVYRFPASQFVTTNWGAGTAGAEAAIGIDITMAQESLTPMQFRIDAIEASP